MGQLVLNLLGSPEILHAGEVLSFRTRKSVALLVYLAVEAGMHPRDKLATLFWPESDKPRATLRSVLRYLRMGLEHADSGETLHLLVERDALGFNVEAPNELDLDVLEVALREDDTSLLRRAAARYRGDFLDGFSLPDAPRFDEWAGYQREYWHRQMNEVFDRLSRTQMDAGEVSSAIKTVLKWRSLAPLQERAHRRLMRLQFIVGDRAAALQTYGHCREVLAEELGVEPAPETGALAARIRREAPSTPERRDPAPEQRRVLEVLPLVGRRDEHSRLTSSFYRVRHGSFKIVSLEGEAGIGKTRLAQEFLSWAQGQDAMTCQARAFESGGRLPYQPIIDILRSLLGSTRISVRENDAGERARSGDPPLSSALHLTVSISPIWLAELGRLLPELRDQYSELPVPQNDETTAQTRLFEAVCRLGAAVADRRPLALFIDDVQWADSASLDLLHYTARRWTEADSPILLLLGIRAEALVRRSDPLRSANSLLEWLAGLERDVALTRLTLEPLSKDLTQELVGRLAGAGEHGSGGAEQYKDGGVAHSPAHQPSNSSAQFAEWLYRETQGHPFFIAETVKALLEDDILATHRDDHGHLELIIPEEDWHPPDGLIAPGIRDIVSSRLSKLSDEAYSVLAAAAILDHDFEFRALCHVSNTEPVDVLPSLDTLQANRLLEESQETNVHGVYLYRFTHDKIRDVAYTEMGDARRQLFHERAFVYLVEAGTAAPAQLAHHAQMAGRIEEAFRYSLAAGDEAMHVYAVQDAIDQYERAHRLLTAHAPLEGDVTFERRRHLYERLGRAYELVNAWENARTIYGELLAFARDADATSLQVATHSHLANLAIQERLDVETAIEHLEQARELAEQAGDRAGLAQTEWSLSHTAYYAFDSQRAIAHGERALALARELEDDALIARCLNALAYAKQGAVPPARLHEAEEHAQDAAHVFGTLGDRAMEADSLTALASVRIHAGRPREALSAAREARDTTVDIDNVWGIASTGFVLAQAHFECGEYGTALDMINEAVTLARENELTQLIAGVLAARGTLYRALQCPGRARLDHQEVRTYFSYLKNPHMLCATATDLAADYAAGGDWEMAFDFAQEAVTFQGRSWMFSLVDYWLVIEALLRGGETQQARVAVEHFGERIRDNPRYAIPYLHSLGLLASWEERYEDALACLEAAADMVDDLDLPGERWQVLAAQAEMHDALGTPSDSFRTYAEETVQQLAETMSEEMEEIREQFVAGAQKTIQG